MHNTKTDRRVKYTKLALRQSLMELLEKKNINKITVKEICKRADINRGTFYSHYKDAYDLMNQIEDELRTEVEQTIAKHQTQAMFTLDFIHEIIESIYVNRDLCKVLLGENGEMCIRDSLVEIYFPEKIQNSLSSDFGRKIISEFCFVFFIFNLA